jgi:hypothetical protein
MGDLLVWVHVPFQAIKRAIAALKTSVIHKHNRASLTSDEVTRDELRQSANDDNQSMRDLKDSLRGGGNPPDERE